MTLLILSFLAGILTILAPCILPILPIILAGSLGESTWKRPFLITLSLALSIVFFTIILKVTTLFIAVPSVFWKYLSGGILVFLGLVYLFPHIWAKIGGLLQFGKSQQVLAKTQDIKSGTLQPIATGFALGPVFSSCSPTYSFLLATVFPASFVSGILYTFSYALGLASILFLIAWGGQNIIKKIRFLADEKGWFKKILGLVFVIIGLGIVTGIDKKVEIWILNSYNVSSIEQGLFDYFNPKKEDTQKIQGQDILPETDSMVKDITNTNSLGQIDEKKDEKVTFGIPQKIEVTPPQITVQNKTEKQVTTTSQTNTSIESEIDDLFGDVFADEESAPVPKATSEMNVENPYKAPEINLTEWINSNGLTMGELKGKVVLIDFWTFGCINCQRTRPYLNAWHKQYKDKGLVIIGVHAPEFAYEKVKANLEKAIKEEDIAYPIVLDNDFTLWKSYNNRYWPAFYFVDKKGFIRHTHFGEGKYKENEVILQQLLEE